MPAEVTASTEIIGLGGAVTPAGLLAAYGMGMFPMAIAIDEAHSATAWYAPAERALLTYPGMHLTRSLRRSMRTFDITYDAAFADVLAGCADPSRDHGWMTAEYQDSYLGLHSAGYAHSVEVWQGGELVGGLLGIELGGLFCADTKFRRVTDASKAAVAGLSQRVFAGAIGPQRVVDAQWLTPHLASLGFQAVPRARYEAMLPGLQALPGTFGGGIRTV
ncbi:MAG: leucyl/phenylalanyl-tRNA---protein transferase [Actinomycetota bacterium]|nr:leucyl/phenylalanyl-tRNA---protein transferase [Actinomycetota bacterium]